MCLWSVEGIRDQGLMIPVDPDEFGKGEEALEAFVFFFSVSKARASSEAVVGIGPWIAFEFLKKKSFLIERDWMFAMDPDLEVTRGCFYYHASGFEGTIGEFVMGQKQGARQIISHEVV